MNPDWLENLEARLEQQLEVFLETHPAQRQRLDAAEQQERQQRLRQRSAELQRQAARHRQHLLGLAAEIRRWQERSRQARSAGAQELAERAETQSQRLLEQGRGLWKQLEDLGREAARLQDQQPAPAPVSNSGSPGLDNDLDKDWAAFETEQELERLKRRNGR